MMENVIEKHYVPTSGSGLDANLVAALRNILVIQNNF